MLHGDLGLVSLATLLQMLMTEEKSGRLCLTHKQCRAEVFMRQGRPVACRLDPFDLEGREALMELLDWEEGRFDFMADEYDGPDEIRMNVVQALIEHSAHRDEGD